MSDVINGVPRELLERLALAAGTVFRLASDAKSPMAPEYAKTHDEARALLATQPQSIVEQSAPAGEREAFQEAATSFSLPLDESTHRGTFYEDDRTFWMHRGWQAGAAWQRAQSAGVPEGWRDLLRRARRFVEDWDDDSQEFMDLCGEIDNALAAPAQPAAQHHAVEASDAVQTLIDYAAGKINHAYLGLCPDDVEGSASRDPDCAVCKAMVLAKAAPAQPAAQGLCNCPAGSKPEPHKHAPNCPYRTGAAAQDQGEVQRLREDLAFLADYVWRKGCGHPLPNYLALGRFPGDVAKAALAASTGQEV